MRDVPRTLRELRGVYEGLLRDYPVIRRVVVGGFSSGGAAALEVVLDEAFPVAAFVSGRARRNRPTSPRTRSPRPPRAA